MRYLLVELISKPSIMPSFQLYRKSPKPTRRALADSNSRHASPKHEAKGAESHGKKGWSKDAADGVPK